MHCASWQNSKQLYKTKIQHEHNRKAKEMPRFKNYFILYFLPNCHFTSEMYVSTDEFKRFKSHFNQKANQ